MKKILVFFNFILILFVLLISLNSTIAVGFTYNDDTNHTAYTPSDEVNSQALSSGISYHREIGNIFSKTESKDVAVNVITGKQNNDLKVVSWAVQDNNSGFRKAQLSEIAKNYEENHPGWKVMGLINADQFTLGRGTDLNTTGKDPYIEQTYYPFVADYENWFSVTANAGHGNFVAIKNDGTNDPLNKVSASLNNIAGLYLSLIDENNNVIKKFKVEHLNTNPLFGETSIYSPYYIDIQGTIPNIDVIGEDLFVVEDAELAYVSNSKEYSSLFSGTPKASKAYDAFFGRGVISKVTDSYSVSKGQFVISTTNQELKQELKVGVRVRAQYEYIDSVGEFESGIGFHTVQKDNDKDLPVSGSYNTATRTRSLIGRKLDGSITLIVIDDYKDSYGVTGYGINAILKRFGVVEAYQMDGGGSSQMYIKDGNSFKPVTRSADIPDGSNETRQRSVLNALLFVVREIDLTHDVISSTPNSINIAVDVQNTYGKDIKDIILNINFKSVKVVNGVATVTGLSPNTNYSYTISVENNQGIITNTIYSGTVSTAKREPVLLSVDWSLVDGKYVFVPTFRDRDQAITTCSMYVGKSAVSMVEGKLSIPIIYATPIIVYNYDLNDGYGNRNGYYYYRDIINYFHLVDLMIIDQNKLIIDIYK